MPTRMNPWLEMPADADEFHLLQDSMINLWRFRLLTRSTQIEILYQWGSRRDLDRKEEPRIPQLWKDRPKGSRKFCLRLQATIPRRRRPLREHLPRNMEIDEEDHRRHRPLIYLCRSEVVSGNRSRAQSECLAAQGEQHPSAKGET